MLKPQELTEAVTDYLQDNETEYAIMINGKWGCGKTYFWNNNIVPKLKEKSIKNIYISLYGVKTINEIEQKILYKLLNLSTDYNIKKSDTSSIIAEIPKYFDIILNKLDLGKSNFKPIADLFTGIASQFIFQQTLFANKDKYVICFDDLERLDSDLNIVRVLGFINQFVEHNRIKTVLICNEDEINNLDIYIKRKEKLVWYTYKISPSIEQIIDYFIKDYSEATRNILVEHKKNIIGIKNKCNLVSIR
ncbi:MAG: P-loop NTPase fold protein [Waterburya sp.]